MISIICPIYNEEKYIGRCIESIFNSDYPVEDMEVLFIDGMSTDRTREIITQYMVRYPQLRLLNNPAKIVSPALNIGIKEAKGEIIFRLDAHAIYPTHYFSVLTRYLVELDADNVGGVCRTLPVNTSPVCTAIASALSCPFGMGNSYFRIGSKEIKKVDTVPFGCFKKEIFKRIGFFDEELIRNQDDEFNGRIIKTKGTIYLIPEIVIDYFARDSIKKVIKMFYQYGLFKPLVNKKLGRPSSIRQFFPVFFVIGLITGGIWSIISSKIVFLYLSVLGLHILLALYYSINEVKKTGNKSIFFLLPGLFAVIHISYGVGYLVGIYKILSKKSFSARSNR